MPAVLRPAPGPVCQRPFSSGAAPPTISRACRQYLQRSLSASAAKNASGPAQAQPEAVRQAAQLFAAAAVSLLATASGPQAALAAVSDPAQESGVQQVERARKQVEYKLGLQQQVKRAEEIARRAQLERVVEGVQARLDLKLTEERANLQAAKASGLPEDRVGHIQQMILQLETATEKLAQQRAAAEAQLGQQEIADEAALLAKQEVLAERAKAMEGAALAAAGTVRA